MGRTDSKGRLRVLSAKPFYHDMIRESCNSWDLEEVVGRGIPKWLFKVTKRHERLLGLLALLHVLLSDRVIA